jgi:uncharacterized membrane protein SirB2
MIEYYGEIKLLHIACVLLSGSLFALRGLLTLKGISFANHRGLARLSYVIDTTLLAAAIMLTIIIHQYPFIQPWLTVKVLLLVVYIALGVFALRRGKTRLSKAGFFAAALCVYAFIISVAVTHNPRVCFSRRAAGAPTSLQRELAWPALNFNLPSRSENKSCQHGSCISLERTDAFTFQLRAHAVKIDAQCLKFTEQLDHLQQIALQRGVATP